MSTEITHRNTRQRAIILEELCKLSSHPTANELYDIVRRRLPNVSLGTVYRNLEFLADQGVIKKLKVSGSGSRFDGNPGRHNHVTCLKCGRIDDLHKNLDEIEKQAGEELNGYDIMDYRLEFIGICPECNNKQTVKNRKVKK